MRLYNTRTRKIEEFKSLVPGEVKMYSCGPTVYDHVHLGNIRAFIFADLLRKTFEFFDYKVTQIMNITDFGHLKGDADDTEDKMSEGLRREGLPRTLEGMKILADKYTNIFFEDIKKVNIRPALHYPRAIEYVEEYIKIIKGLEEKGFAYKISDGVYFDTSKDPNYGCMSLLDKNNKRESRIGENTEKRNQADFALWKFADDRLSVVGFQSPWGVGFPGWHIECSGMVLKFLGEQIDIHTGGVDHINVHHTNEMAQSESFTGKTYSTFFCHNEFLNFNNEKMAKSKGNFFTLQSVEEKNLNPLAYRYLCLQSHYRQKMNFSFESIEASQNALKRLQNNILELKSKIDNSASSDSKIFSNKYLTQFKENLSEDLNTAAALATLWEMLKDEAISPEEKYLTAIEMDKVLSLDLGISSHQHNNQAELMPEIQILIDKRNKLRADKNFSEADEIREQLKELGYEAVDK
jgi:cysteinyl-tRNA synthetase